MAVINVETLALQIKTMCLGLASLTNQKLSIETYSFQLATIIDNYINGGGNSNSQLILGEVPIGLINDSNKVFQLSKDFSRGTTMVYLRGSRQRLDIDYTENITTKEITFVNTPFSGDSIYVDYISL